MYRGSIVIQNIKYGSWVGQNGFHDYMTKFGTLSHIVIVMKTMFCYSVSSNSSKFFLKTPIVHSNLEQCLKIGRG
jgi:hypothetical protein